MNSNSLLPGSSYAISDDGRIRLHLAELRAVHLLHLISGLDENIPDTISAGALPTTISGYTEWVSDTVPVISIGWDWQMSDSSRPVRVGEPRSNLALQDAEQLDTACIETAVLLEAFVDTLDWQRVVLHQIVARYNWQ